MSYEEAMRIIETVTGNVAGTRADHQKIAEALGVIKAICDEWKYMKEANGKIGPLKEVKNV